MPRLSVNLLQTPGIIRDTPSHRLIPAAFSDGQNVRFNYRGAESLPGDLEVFSSASITPLWIKAFPPISLPIWVYGNLTEMWAYDGSHTEITRVASDYSGDASERWQATMLNGIAVFNNAIDTPQAWTDIDPSTPLVDLPNWDTNRVAKSIRSFKNFLIALNLTDSGTARPYRVLWSDSADVGTYPGSWDSTDPSTDSREFDLAETEDHLVDQRVLGDVNIIYKETTTWGMQYIGPPYYFRFWNILSDKGLLWRDCVTGIPGGHFVVTQDDIIIHGGQMEQYKSLLNGAQRDWLFSTIDPSYFYNSFVVTHPRNNEVYFCFPSLGSTYADTAIVWNWVDKSLGIRSLTSTPFAATGPIGDSITDDEAWGI